MFRIALDTARSLTDARFGQAPKCKLNRTEYQDVIRATYLLAQANTAKDIREMLKKSIAEGVDPEVMVGDLDLIIMEAHNRLVSDTKYGKLSFNKMELEDLIYEKPMSKLVKNDMRQRIKGMR